MRVSLTALAIAFVLPDPSHARSKVSVQTAEQICLERAQKFAQTPYGLDSDLPHPNQVKDRFRACVYAKSGQYPQRKLNVRGWKVTL